MTWQEYVERYEAVAQQYDFGTDRYELLFLLACNELARRDDAAERLRVSVDPSSPGATPGVSTDSAATTGDVEPTMVAAHNPRESRR